MVGFRQVDQLEVERKGACKLIGPLRVGGRLARKRLCFLQPALRPGGVAARFSLPPCDGDAPQAFHRAVKVLTRLFPQHLAQQRAEGADVAAQRHLLQLAVACLEFL